MSDCDEKYECIGDCYFDDFDQDNKAIEYYLKMKDNDKKLIEKGNHYYKNQEYQMTYLYYFSMSNNNRLK